MGIFTSKLSIYFFNFKELLSHLCSKCVGIIHDPRELRKWAGIFAFSNVSCSVFFYLWHLSAIDTSMVTYLLVTSIVLHLFIGARFIQNMLRFGRLACAKWAWLSLIFVSPLGFFLLYYVFNSKYWILDEVSKDKELLQIEIEKDKKQSAKSFKHKKLESRFNYSLAHLKKINEEVAREILVRVLRITNDSFSELSFFQISTVIALATICKQCKQKSFDNLIWGAHWYEDKFFTFGFRNTKPISTYNKYPMTVGAIVLDELNNYRKIIDAKNQIKKHLSFSDAKIISLHMGDEYKLYVNQQ